jgi:hypothetical protein
MNENILRQIGKTQTYKDLSKHFDGSLCNTVKVLGNCAGMIKENEFNNFKEWAAFWYQSEFSDNLPDAVELLKNYTIPILEKEYSISEYEECILYHTLVQTWDGLQREKEILEYLKSKRPNSHFRLSSYEEDRKLGIDILQFNNETKELERVFQVKPISFKKIMDTKYDYNTPKLKNFINKYQKDAWYIFYKGKNDYEYKKVG